MIYVSPSKLENFRLYYTEAWNGFITEQMVIDSIMGIREFSEKAEKGSAFHTLIEVKDPDIYKTVTRVVYDPPFDSSDHDVWNVPSDSGIVSFSQMQVDRAKEYKRSIPGASQEVKHKWMLIDNICVRMIFDVIWGNFIDDIKTADKPKSYNDYEPSLQWKIYCLALELPVFRYQIFQFAGQTIYRDTFVMLPIPKEHIRSEIDKWTDLFIRFAESKGLMGYLLKENVW